jgi:hypothetical protein
VANANADVARPVRIHRMATDQRSERKFYTVILNQSLLSLAQETKKPLPKR